MACENIAYSFRGQHGHVIPRSDLHGETPTSFQCAKNLSELSVSTKSLTVGYVAIERKKISPC